MRKILLFVNICFCVSLYGAATDVLEIQQYVEDKDVLVEFTPNENTFSFFYKKTEEKKFKILGKIKSICFEGSFLLITYINENRKIEKMKRSFSELASRPRDQMQRNSYSGDSLSSIDEEK